MPTMQWSCNMKFPVWRFKFQCKFHEAVLWLGFKKLQNKSNVNSESDKEMRKLSHQGFLSHFSKNTLPVLSVTW